MRSILRQFCYCKIRVKNSHTASYKHILFRWRKRLTVDRGRLTGKQPNAGVDGGRMTVDRKAAKCSPLLPPSSVNCEQYSANGQRQPKAAPFSKMPRPSTVTPSSVNFKKLPNQPTAPSVIYLISCCTNPSSVSIPFILSAMVGITL
jgi:hypothetical protein